MHRDSRSCQAPILIVDKSRYRSCLLLYLSRSLKPGLVPKSEKFVKFSSCSCLETKGTRLSVLYRLHSTFDFQKVSFSDFPFVNLSRSLILGLVVKYLFRRSGQRANSMSKLDIKASPCFPSMGIDITMGSWWNFWTKVYSSII